MAKRKALNLTDFMVNQLGGQDAVMRQFLAERIGSLSTKGLTIAKILEMGQSEGWADQLMEMKLDDLLNAVGKSPRKAPARGGKKTTRKKTTTTKRNRLTAEEVAALKESLVQWLTANPWSSRSDIAAGSGVELSKVTPLLKSLKDAKDIKSKGERRNTVYAVKGA